MAFLSGVVLMMILPDGACQLCQHEDCQADRSVLLQQAVKKHENNASAGNCCDGCSGPSGGTPFCSPQSGNCYTTKAKEYYLSCGHWLSCCYGCSGRAPYCSPQSGTCYTTKAKDYYLSCGGCTAEGQDMYVTGKKLDCCSGISECLVDGKYICMQNTCPQPSSANSISDWDGENMAMTHYWDCSGQGCDASVLQPFDASKYVSPPGYGPQDPNDFGGSVYGEKMLLTGAASDALSALMGPDDGCCGADYNDGGIGGCGKCVLIQNPDSLNPEWTAVIMKKNRCPPASFGCDANKPHFDVAVPGFDNLLWSLANICGRPGTGFDNQAQSEALGSWYTQCSNTADCSYLCDELPETFRAGCKLFASWGWKGGDPKSVKFKAVPCPPAFVEHVSKQFDRSGVTA